MRPLLLIKLICLGLRIMSKDNDKTENNNKTSTLYEKHRTVMKPT